MDSTNTVNDIFFSFVALMTNHRRGSHRWIQYLHCSNISARTFSLTLFVPWRRRKSQFKNSRHKSFRKVHKIEQDQDQREREREKEWPVTLQIKPAEQKKYQIKRGSIAAIINFLIRFAGGRSLPRIRSSRSRMLCNSFQRRKLKKRKETNFDGHQR